MAELAGCRTLAGKRVKTKACCVYVVFIIAEKAKAGCRRVFVAFIIVKKAMAAGKKNEGDRCGKD